MQKLVNYHKMTFPVINQDDYSDGRYIHLIDVLFMDDTTGSYVVYRGIVFLEKGEIPGEWLLQVVGTKGEKRTYYEAKESFPNLVHNRYRH